ncbi:MAG TPA: hypothetical protein VLU25_02715 [Acidobacteriota bacterium]|nr:hypothetical protein [Acidobacteriota bacterium]
MSLKGFHIVFIVLSSAMAFVVGLWALQQDGGGYTALAVLSLAMGAGLVGYGLWFLRKLKHVSTL